MTMRWKRPSKKYKIEEWKKGDLEWNTHYYTVRTLPDKDGKQYFDIDWMDTNLGYHCNETGLRGQNFFGILEDHIKHSKSLNNNVTFIKTIYTL